MPRPSLPSPLPMSLPPGPVASAWCWYCCRPPACSHRRAIAKGAARPPPHFPVEIADLLTTMTAAQLLRLLGTLVWVGATPIARRRVTVRQTSALCHPVHRHRPLFLPHRPRRRRQLLLPHRLARRAAAGPPLRSPTRRAARSTTGAPGCTSTSSTRRRRMSLRT